ncbi:MAG TPA: nuclear transport factor 2 family protein [Dongiaceae bacterium]|nr:nuclear transport factor 2 family protein [Dongiaceae bacterium]
MKKAIFYLAGCLLFCGVLAAQEEDLPANPEMQRQELINLEKENARALKLHNATFFRAAYSDDFSGVSRFGEVINKTGMLREVVSLNADFDNVVASDIQVKMYRDAAYVISLRSEVGHAEGKRFYNQFRVLRVYLNTPRGWKVISELETRLVAESPRD